VAPFYADTAGVKPDRAPLDRIVCGERRADVGVWRDAIAGCPGQALVGGAAHTTGAGGGGGRAHCRRRA
jgi:hypothetical protein